MFSSSILDCSFRITEGQQFVVASNGAVSNSQVRFNSVVLIFEILYSYISLQEFSYFKNLFSSFSFNIHALWRSFLCFKYWLATSVLLLRIFLVSVCCTVRFRWGWRCTEIIYITAWDTAGYSVERCYFAGKVKMSFCDLRMITFSFQLLLPK